MIAQKTVTPLNTTRKRVILPAYKWETIEKLIEQAAQRVNADRIKKGYMTEILDSVQSQLAEQ